MAVLSVAGELAAARAGPGGAPREAFVRAVRRLAGEEAAEAAEAAATLELLARSGAGVRP